MNGSSLTALGDFSAISKEVGFCRQIVLFTVLITFMPIDNGWT